MVECCDMCPWCAEDMLHKNGVIPWYRANCSCAYNKRSIIHSRSEVTQMSFWLLDKMGSSPPPLRGGGKQSEKLVLKRGGEEWIREDKKERVIWLNILARNLTCHECVVNTSTITGPTGSLEYSSLRKMRGFHGRTMKNCVFWDLTPCGSCNYRRFGGT
jgi:hypothetical protein